MTLLPDPTEPESESKPTWQRRVFTVLRVVLPLGILALLWNLADGPEVLRILRSADWRWLFAAFLTANLQIVFSALRWRLTASALDQTISHRRAVMEYYLSQLLNLTLPSGILGDAGRAVRMRHQAGMLRASQAVLIERMAGQIALFVVLFAGFAAVPWLSGGVILPIWVSHMVLGIGAVLAGIVLCFTLMHQVPGPLQRIASGFQTASLRALCARRVWPRQLLFSTLTVTCNLATVTFAARATGTEMPLAAILTIVPLMLTAMLLPVSAGGWGVREGAAAALWPLMGYPAAAGVAASIAFGLVIMAASLPGVLMLWGPSHLTAPRRPDPLAEPAE